MKRINQTSKRERTVKAKTKLRFLKHKQSKNWKPNALYVHHLTISTANYLSLHAKINIHSA